MTMMNSMIGRGFALTVLAVSLTACQSMKPAVPAAEPNIPQEFTALAQDGSPSIASR